MDNELIKEALKAFEREIAARMKERDKEILKDYKLRHQVKDALKELENKKDST